MRWLFSTAPVLLAATLSFAWQGGKEPVTYESPNKCKGNHGEWRWAAKTEEDRPPDSIPATHRVTPTDVGNWHPLEGHIDKNTPRRGREKEWYELTGKVVLVAAEHDGDLHIVLEDAPGKGDVHVVVEVPLKHHASSPWTQIRTTVFNWTDTQFPFTLGEQGRHLKLKERPVIRVVGKAFYDAEHAGTKTPNRRENGRLAVWEIHPVMRLRVLTKNESGG